MWWRRWSVPLVGLICSSECELVKEVYVYELFDKQKSRVMTVVDSQQWGVWYPNLTKKYDVEFGSAGKGQFGGVGVVRFAFDLVLGLVLIHRSAALSCRLHLCVKRRGGATSKRRKEMSDTRS
ncbi:hypothetical protein Droror1_Dr00027222 [Drosera rotundifolia]